MVCLDHKYEPGPYGVCRRCGGESPRLEAKKIANALEPGLQRLGQQLWARHPNNPERQR